MGILMDTSITFISGLGLEIASIFDHEEGLLLLAQSARSSSKADIKANNICQGKTVNFNHVLNNELSKSLTSTSSPSIRDGSHRRKFLVVNITLFIGGI